MKKRYKKELVVAVAIIAAACLVWLFLLLLPPMQLALSVNSQMKAGEKYMKSLNLQDVEIWINRADRFLAEYDPEKGSTIPDDLKALRILHIDVDPVGYVGFMWVTGWDHTGLIVNKDTNGVHTVTAVYNDYEQEQLWPRK